MSLKFWEKETTDNDTDSEFKEAPNKKVNNLPTQTVLIIRAVVGAYLLYVAYQLLTSKDSSMERWTVLIFVVVFALFGVFVIGFTIYIYAKGLYVGGKADIEIEDAPDEPDVDTSGSIEADKFSTEGAIDAEVKDVEVK